MKATVLTLAVVMALSSPAAAEWGLYVNRDNKAWSLERTFAFENDCKVEAHKTWKSGAVKGVACQEYAATSFARQQTAPHTTSRTSSSNYDDETVYSRPGATCFKGGGCTQVEYTRRVDSSGNVRIDRDVTYETRKGDGSGYAPGVTIRVPAGSIK